MSEKDFDWSDDLDFESLAEEKEMTGDFGEPDDSFAGFEDLADYADSPETDPGSSLQDEGEFASDEVQLAAEPDSPPAEGAERVYYAGLKEFEAEEESARQGVTLLRKTYDQLVEIGQDRGVTPPPVVG